MLIVQYTQVITTYTLMNEWIFLKLGNILKIKESPLSLKLQWNDLQFHCEYMSRDHFPQSMDQLNDLLYHIVKEYIFHAKELLV